MGRQDMDNFRANIKIDQSERLRLIIGKGGDALGMECVECEELLEWSSEKRWWTCGCGLETTPIEARVIMESAREVLDKQIADLGGRRLRQEGFWTWVMDKLRRKPPALPGS